mmetsp:Transcript_148524/g.210977  ORF Transcript_148524/g.210977 Transcript_148524/m.210977 type:complete len:367 (+) Transcript_148524:821-1921(+)
MEGPTRVGAGLELNPLIFQVPSKRFEIRLGASIQLWAILYAMNRTNLHLVPSRLRRHGVHRRLLRSRPEHGHDVCKLLGARKHLYQLLFVHASRRPSLAEQLRAMSQPLFRLLAFIREPLPPGAKHVRLWSVGAQGGVDQTRKTVSEKQGLHVVAVTDTRTLSRGHRSAVGDIVQEALVVRTRGDQPLEIRSRSRVDLIISPLREHDWHSLRHLFAGRVGIDQEAGTTPEAGLPQADEVDTSFRCCTNHVWTESIHFFLDVVQILLHREVRRLRIWDSVAEVRLVAGVGYHGRLSRVQLLPEAWPDDENPRALPADRPGCLHGDDLLEVGFEIGKVDPPLATSDGLEEAVDRVESCFALHDMVSAV